MSRRKKLPHGKKKPAKSPSTEADSDEALIADTTRIFTCFTEISHDFLHQCVDELERFDCDIDYNQLAIQMWTGGPGRATELVDVLTAYLELRQRHHAALTALQPRLRELLALPAHDHLEPGNHWRDLVRQRVLAPPPANCAPLDRQISTELQCR